MLLTIQFNYSGHECTELVILASFFPVMFTNTKLWQAKNPTFSKQIMKIQNQTTSKNFCHNFTNSSLLAMGSITTLSWCLLAWFFTTDFPQILNHGKLKCQISSINHEKQKASICQDAKFCHIFSNSIQFLRPWIA